MQLVLPCYLLITPGYLVVTSGYFSIYFWLPNRYYCQGRSQNLKEVPQNFMEVFNVDDVKTNGTIQKNKHR